MGNGSQKSGGRVTLADVARVAGLSPTTVSLALNHPPERSHLSQPTRQRAIEAARQLGYRPNWRARALAKKQTFTVGLVHDARRPFITPANEAIVMSLACTLRESGYYALVVPLAPDSDEWRDVIRSDRLDGCLLVFPPPPQVQQVHAEAGVPMVMVNVMTHLPVPQVLADDRGGMRQAMAHLLQLGHRDIAFVDGEAVDHFSRPARQEEYERSMNDAGLRQHVRIITDDELGEVVRAPLTSREWPTALVCYDHSGAMRLLSGCCERRISVPEHVSVVAFNDVYPTALTAPPLTTVRIPGDQLGRRSAQLLLDLIENRDKDTPASDPGAAACEWIAEQLVIRASTGRPRG